MRAAGRLRTGDLHRGEAALLPAELQPHGALPRCRPGRNARTKGERTPIRRAWFRELDSNQRAPASRAGWDAFNPSRNELEPPPGATLASRPYKGRPLVRAGGKYARRDSNPQSHGPQPCPSTCLRHERKRAATRCRPGPSAVRRRSRSRARRRSYRGRTRTCVPLGQSQGGMPATHPVPVKTRVERASRNV